MRLTNSLPSAISTSSKDKYTEKISNVQELLQPEHLSTTAASKRAIDLVQQSGSLIPILGALLHIRGKPFTDDFPMMLEPLFDLTIPEKSVCKTGRQVGKSTTQAARTIMFSAIINHFQTLTVTPQFELTRRFSNNYIKPLLEKSPVSSVMLNTNCDKNVLQRTLTNQSIMHFSFAFLDADRIRGIASDRIHIDECVKEFSKIQTPTGTRLVGKTLRKKDVILAHDDSGSIVTDEVTNVVYKGLRPTYKITLVDGRVLECTSNEKLRTNIGWLYLQEIIDYGNQRRYGHKEQSRCWIRKADAARDTDGRRLYAVVERRMPVRTLLHNTWSSTGSILQAQSGHTERLRANITTNTREQGLGQRELRLRHSDLSGIRLLALPLLQAKPEEGSAGEVCNERIRESDGRSESGLLVHGRRKHKPSRRYNNVSHSVIHEKRSTATSEQAERFWFCAENTFCEKAWPQAEILGNRAMCCGHSKICGVSTPLHAREYAVQAGDNSQRFNGTYAVSILRGHDTEGPTEWKYYGSMPEERVSECKTQDNKQRVCGEKSRCNKRPAQESILCGCGKDSQKKQDSCSKTFTKSGVSRESKRTKESTQTCSCSEERDNNGNLPILRGTNTEGKQGFELNDSLQQGRMQECEAPDYLQEKLCEVEIELIEYAGKQRVWDIETKNHHTLFVNDFAVHNCQDVGYDLIDEISRTADRSKWAIEDYTGTPKTFDGTLEVLWRKSSMAEWIIPCKSCKHQNNPNVEVDGLKMIQDRGLCCAKCGALIDGKYGYWYHLNPEKRYRFAGWHAPQIIFPFHYAVPGKWRKIVAAKNSAVSKRIFMNEIMGESCDTGAKLMTEGDLAAACVLPIDMSYRTARKLTRAYDFRAIGVDWGGRGTDGTSRTKAAILGMRTDGRCDLLYAEDMSSMPDAGHEITRTLMLFKEFNCNVLAHDAAGTAGTRDVLLNHVGFPRDNIMPMSYVSAWSKDMLSYVEPNNRITWPHYSLDKTRSLVLLIECIKHGYMFFPAWKSCSVFLKDFLSLVEEKSSTRRSYDSYLIRRADNQCDDFAHALNFAAVACFHTQNKYPDLVSTVKVFSKEYLDELEELNSRGSTLSEWEAEDQ